MYVPQKRFKRSLRDAQDRVSSSFKNFDSKKLSDGGDFLDNVGDHIGDSGDLLGDGGDLLGDAENSFFGAHPPGGFFDRFPGFFGGLPC